MTNCRFGEDTEYGVFCCRFTCACSDICTDEKKCLYFIEIGELTEEEIEIMREVSR